MASLLQDEWRGLAHFRTESRRRVFKKVPAERTASELYVLEEVFSDVKLINNLPFSKRLEICKFIHYEDVPENTPVYEEGDVGEKFYVIFTGSVKVTAIFGRKPKLLNTLYAGDYFGEAAFSHEYYRRKETVTTLRRCELLSLSKSDYENALKTEVTEEVRAHYKTLQTVSVLQKIPREVITFQGEEAREMYFIKSGECRVVMHVTAPADASPRSLPRAASSLSQYRPTTHDHCKQEVKDIQKHWGHPHFLTRPRPLSCPTTRSQSVPPMCLSSMSTTEPSVVSSAVVERPASAPPTRVSFSQRVETTSVASHVSKIHEWDVDQSTVSDGRQGTPPRESTPPRQSTPARGSMIRRIFSAQGQQDRQQSVKQMMHPKQRHTLPYLPSYMKKSYLEQESEQKRSSRSSRKSRPLSQMSMRSYNKRKSAPSQNKDYSLDSLLKEISSKFCDEAIQDLEFSDKEAMLWGMGTADTGLLRGDVSDPIHYQTKFEIWARSVILREKKLQALEDNSEDGSLASFRTCQDPELEELFKTGTILDVGGLQPGEFFGEAGILRKGKRSASILTVTEVEVLVLSNSDFTRRLDMDIIDCLSSNNYKKADFMLDQFNRTYRWERVKKKVMNDALMLKKERFPNRYHHDMSDAMRRKATPLLL